MLLLCAGIFVFMDRYHFDDLKDPIDDAKRQKALNGFTICHPLTFTRSFFEWHLNTSYETLLMKNEVEFQQTAFVGKKTSHRFVGE